MKHLLGELVSSQFMTLGLLRANAGIGSGLLYIKLFFFT
jgi:hypothetical protein